LSAPSPPPEVVVFDLGKVLLDFDYGIATRKLAAHSRVSADAVRAAIDQSPLLYAYETGRLTCDDFYSEVCRATGYRAPMDVFSASFSDIFTPIEPMVELHSRLRRRGVPTFIFSNTNPIAIGHIRRQFPFFAGFDGYVLSYEHRSMKPEPGLYEQVERTTKKTESQILYIDDRPENIETGRALGWQVIHHVRAEETIATVEKLLLRPDGKT
jgi:HAD superfamily hydrolase (TIGR01509 family)